MSRVFTFFSRLFKFISLLLLTATPHIAFSETFVGQGPAPSSGIPSVVQSLDNPPYGNVNGAVGLIAVVPGSDQMYIGSPNGGIWTNPNGGTSWQSLTSNLASLSIASLALDPNNSSVIIAGTGLTSNGSVCRTGPCFVSGSGGVLNGLLYSTNKGNNWTSLNPNGVFTGQTIADVSIKGATILAGTYTS